MPRNIPVTSREYKTVNNSLSELRCQQILSVACGKYASGLLTPDAALGAIAEITAIRGFVVFAAHEINQQDTKPNK